MYKRQLLKPGLKKNDGDYVAQPSSVAMLQGRSTLKIEKGSHTVNLLWTITDVDREARLLQISILIGRGLMGGALRCSNKRTWSYSRVCEPCLV